jgi:hypothetical protein
MKRETVRWLARFNRKVVIAGIVLAVLVAVLALLDGRLFQSLLILAATALNACFYWMILGAVELGCDVHEQICPAEAPPSTDSESGDRNPWGAPMPVSPEDVAMKYLSEASRK